MSQIPDAMFMGWDYFWAKIFHRFQPVMHLTKPHSSSSSSTRSNNRTPVPVPAPAPPPVQLRSRIPDDEEDVAGKIVLITGGNGGLGQVTAIQLVLRGAIVVIACRNMVKGEEAVAEIKKFAVVGSQVHLMHLDLSHLANIREFAAEFCKKFPHINILINNAGVMDGNQGVLKRTKDGFESNMGINHLGHFLLTLLLLDHVKKGAPSRILCISSTLHRLARLNIDDLLVENTSTDLGFLNLIAYNNSKLANIYFVKQLSKRLNEECADGSPGSSNVRVFSLCPGLVRTELFRNDVGIRRRCNSFIMFFAGLKVDQGCETILYCSLSKQCLKDPCGQLYRFRTPWKKAFKEIDKNDGLAERLWEISEELVQFKSPISAHSKSNSTTTTLTVYTAEKMEHKGNEEILVPVPVAASTQISGSQDISVSVNITVTENTYESNNYSKSKHHIPDHVSVELGIDQNSNSNSYINNCDSDELNIYGITRL